MIGCDRTVKYIIKRNYIHILQEEEEKEMCLSHRMAVSLHTLPIELIYRILDHVNNKTLFMSCHGVCQRLNNILDTYKPYQIISHNIFLLKSFISHDT